jgi:hypothetical protein
VRSSEAIVAGGGGAAIGPPPGSKCRAGRRPIGGAAQQTGTRPGPEGRGAPTAARSGGWLIACGVGSGCASGASCAPPCGALYLDGGWPCALLRLTSVTDRSPRIPPRPRREEDPSYRGPPPGSSGPAPSRGTSRVRAPACGSAARRREISAGGLVNGWRPHRPPPPGPRAALTCRSARAYNPA